MENSLKQRIIGAVVLAALAIIFLPTILKEKSDNGQFESRIPDKPKGLEEYRVDKQKIEKLVQEKGEIEIRNEQVNPREDSNSDKNLKVAVNNEIATAKDEKAATARKTKAKSTNSSISLKQPVAEIDKLASDTTKATSNKNSPVNKLKPTAEEPQKISDKFSSAAWVVQVASFTSESNATNLVSKLKQSKFKAYRRKSVADGKSVHRVFVGPFLDKPKAEKATRAISKVSETKVALRPFDPVKH